MRFVSARPTLPPGARIGAASVERVLFSDGICEVYELHAESFGSDVYIACPHEARPVAIALPRLRSWLADGGAEILELPADALRNVPIPGVAVRLRGRWMASIPTEPLPGSALYGLLLSLLELGMRGRAAGLTASLVRPLLWQSGLPERPQFVSLFAREGWRGDKVMVREVVQTFLWAATGVESMECEIALDSDRLLRWCQNADPSLARVIARCFDLARPIETLDELRLEIGACLQELAPNKKIHQLVVDRYVALGPLSIGHFFEPEIRGPHT